MHSCGNGADGSAGNEARKGPSEEIATPVAVSTFDQHNVVEVALEHGGRNGVCGLTGVRKHTDGNYTAVVIRRIAKLHQCASNNWGSTAIFLCFQRIIELLLGG